MLITFAVYLITHGVLLWQENMLQFRLPEWLYDRYVWLLAAIFLLAMDFWAWGRVEPVIFGVPIWVGYFVILSALQTVVMVYLIKEERGEFRKTGPLHGKSPPKPHELDPKAS